MAVPNGDVHMRSIEVERHRSARVGSCGTAPRNSVDGGVRSTPGSSPDRTEADEAWWRPADRRCDRLVGSRGLVHLDLYFGGYRNAGSVPNFGRSILLNAIASGVIAIAVAAAASFVRLAGIALPVVTLAAFTFTHTGHTFLEFQGDGLQPSPQAQLVLVAEVYRDHPVGGDVSTVARRTRPLRRCRHIASGWRHRRHRLRRLRHLLVQQVRDDRHCRRADDGGDRRLRFTPQVLTVAAGTTVTWTNNDSLEHSVVATNQSFVSNPLDSATTFQFRFDAPGEHTTSAESIPR